MSHNNYCWKIIEKNKQVINFEFPLIMYWRDSGIINWYDIPEEIGRIGIMLNKLSKKAKINSISSKHYLTLAKRPSYSVLDISETQELLNVEPIDWKISILYAFENI